MNKDVRMKPLFISTLNSPYYLHKKVCTWSGVNLENVTTPLENLTFDTVQMISDNSHGSKYHTCTGVMNAKAVGNTHSIPNFLGNHTTPHQIL